MIGDAIVLGSGGESATIIVNNTVQTDAVSASNGVKTIQAKWKPYLNPKWRNLPSGYTQVEYIESHGAEYINPNVNTANDLHIKCKLFTGSAIGVMGGRYTNGSVYRSGVYWVNYTTSRSEFQYSTTSSYSTVDMINKYLELDWNRNVLTVYKDGSVYYTNTYSTTTFADSNIPFLLFAAYNGTVGISYSDGEEIESITIEKNDALILDYVPCIRDSDSTYGMYDMVSQTFKENDGTGAFTGSSAVPQYLYRHEIPRIGSYGDWVVSSVRSGYDTNTKTVTIDEAKTFETTMDSYKKYLYNLGDECTESTGGWGTNGYTVTGYTVVAGTKNSNNMFIGSVANPYQSLLGANNPIDLTNYTKLFVQYEVTLSGSVFRTSTKTLDTNDPTKYDLINATTNPAEIDVGSLSGNQYVAFSTGNNAGRKMTIYKSWLE